MNQEYDPRHYQFARSSGLPLNYFRRRIDWSAVGDVLVVVAAIVVIAALLCGWPAP